MKQAIISDIHANIDALNAVMDDISSQGITDIACLGDIVGYGAAPAECVEVVRDRCSVVVTGNHDHMVARRIDLTEERQQVREHVLPGITLAAEQLPKDAMDWLNGLPFVATRGDCTFVHSSLDRPEAFSYLLYDRDFLPHFAKLTTNTCFSGHTHYAAGAIEEGDRIRFIPFIDDSAIVISGVDKASFDVGSVGQPRDGDPRAAYGIFDTVALSFQPRRVAYDVEAAQKRMKDARQPIKNSERLARGQ